MSATEKLLKAILPICEVKEGEVTERDGKKYRYDFYQTKYPAVFNSVVNLFDKAATENGQPYSTNFYHQSYSFHYARPTMKGQPNGKITFSKLVILD